jgi:hypothetical protein
MVPIGVLGLAACSGSPDSLGGRPPAASSPALRVTHVLPRGGESTASLYTLPNATCTLSPSPSSSPAVAPLRLFSDDDGVVRVHLRHLDLAVEKGELVLACTDDAGRGLTQTIDVHIGDAAEGVAPEPHHRVGKPTLPVLEGDPAALSDAELFVRGYPPRPDAARAPAQYAKWLDLVTSGPTLIAPHTVVDPSRDHRLVRETVSAEARGASTNWSGYVITTPASSPEYAWIYGEWTVPQAFAESGFFSKGRSSLFVGLDGWGTPDVVQAGTDQDTVTAHWIQTATYNAWTEWAPAASLVLSNFPVNPGDDIGVWTWVRDASGNWSTTPTVGWFYLWNKTENMYAYASTAAPTGTTFQGHSAEWILGRPRVDGDLSSLAQYASPTRITNALAYDLAGAPHGYTSDTSWQLDMVDGAVLLSSVAPVDASTMAFTWVNHHH